MATYPTGIPSYTAITSSSYPQAEDVNVPNADFVAWCTAMGINPQIIVDSTTPTSSPADVAHVLGMYGNIVKTIAGVSSWNNSAVPSKQLFYGHGGGATVPIGITTNYLNSMATGISSTYNPAAFIFNYPATLLQLSFWVEILNVQPSDGYLEFQVYKNGSLISNDVEGWYMDIPFSATAGIYHFPGSYRAWPTFSVNDTFAIGVANLSPDRRVCPDRRVGCGNDSDRIICQLFYTSLPQKLTIRAPHSVKHLTRLSLHYVVI